MGRPSQPRALRLRPSTGKPRVRLTKDAEATRGAPGKRPLSAGAPRPSSPLSKGLHEAAQRLVFDGVWPLEDGSPHSPLKPHAVSQRPASVTKTKFDLQVLGQKGEVGIMMSTSDDQDVHSLVDRAVVRKEHGIKLSPLTILQRQHSRRLLNEVVPEYDTSDGFSNDETKRMVPLANINSPVRHVVPVTVVNASTCAQSSIVPSLTDQEYGVVRGPESPNIALAAGRIRSPYGTPAALMDVNRGRAPSPFENSMVFDTNDDLVTAAEKAKEEALKTMESLPDRAGGASTSTHSIPRTRNRSDEHGDSDIEESDDEGAGEDADEEEEDGEDGEEGEDDDDDEAEKGTDGEPHTVEVFMDMTAGEPEGMVDAQLRISAREIAKARMLVNDGETPYVTRLAGKNAKLNTICVPSSAVKLSRDTSPSSDRDGSPRAPRAGIVNMGNTVAMLTPRNEKVPQQFGKYLAESRVVARMATDAAVIAASPVRGTYRSQRSLQHKSSPVPPSPAASYQSMEDAEDLLRSAESLMSELKMRPPSPSHNMQGFLFPEATPESPLKLGRSHTRNLTTPPPPWLDAEHKAKVDARMERSGHPDSTATGGLGQAGSIDGKKKKKKKPPRPPRQRSTSAGATGRRKRGAKNKENAFPESIRSKTVRASARDVSAVRPRRSAKQPRGNPIRSPMLQAQRPRSSFEKFVTLEDLQRVKVTKPPPPSWVPDHSVLATLTEQHVGQGMSAGMVMSENFVHNVWESFEALEKLAKQRPWYDPDPRLTPSQLNTLRNQAREVITKVRATRDTIFRARLLMPLAEVDEGPYVKSNIKAYRRVLGEAHQVKARIEERALMMTGKDRSVTSNDATADSGAVDDTTASGDITLPDHIVGPVVWGKDGQPRDPKAVVEELEKIERLERESGPFEAKRQKMLKKKREKEARMRLLRKNRGSDSDTESATTSATSDSSDPPSPSASESD